MKINSAALAKRLSRRFHAAKTDSFPATCNCQCLGLTQSAMVGAAVLVSLAAVYDARAQNTQYFAGDGSALSSSKYTAANGSPTGPFASAFVTNNIIGFGVANGTGTGANVSVGGFSALENFTLAAGGTITNASSGVVPIAVSAGKTLDFGSQAFTAAGGAGYIKNGDGVVALAGAAYGGGFTLNAGTVIVRGVNALGGGATNTLTLNGGIVASNANRDLTGKYTNGITIGGNVQFGDVTGLASASANLTFSNNITLGGAMRTVTLGNGGNVAFGGIISNTSGGLTFAATASGTGRFDVTNTANNFSGPVNINGGEVRFTANGSVGNAANSITVDGGRLAILSGATVDFSARNIFLGATAGTSISAVGTGVITYNGALADKTGSVGILVKQGGGTLSLGGVSTYAGDTSINNGTVQLTTAANRLPSVTTVNIGQAASANVGAFDLNGFNQQIAGLNSTSGSNASTTAKNTVTSATAATLILGGSGTYAFGDGTAANSGVITGSVRVSKTGSGTQTFGDANTYSGGTNLTGGKLLLANTTGSATGSGGVTFGVGATLASGAGNVGIISGLVTASDNTAIIAPGATAASNTGTVGALTLAGGLNVASGVAIAFDLGASSAASDLIQITGGNFTGGTADSSVIFNFNNLGATDGTTYSLINYTGATASGVDLSDFTATGVGGAFVLNGTELDFIAAVPEPATILGGLLMAGALGWNQRRKIGGWLAAGRSRGLAMPT